MLFRIIEARLHALLISVIEGMNGSFMPLNLGKTGVGTHRTAGCVGQVTGLDLVQKNICCLAGERSPIRQCFSAYPSYYTESI